MDTNCPLVTYHVPSEGKKWTDPAGTTGFLGEQRGHQLLRTVGLAPHHHHGEQEDEVEHHHPPATAQDIIKEVDNEDPNLK